MNVNDVILKTLGNYTGKQANLDSEVLREALADELSDNLNRHFVITSKFDDTLWNQQEPGSDY